MRRNVDKKIALDIILDELEKKGSVRLLVKGGSMSPTIRDGAVVKVEKVEEVSKVGKVKKGEKECTKLNASSLSSCRLSLVARFLSSCLLSLVARFLPSCRLSLVPCTIKPGTVICYRSGGWFLVHRVTAIDRRAGLITVEGDSRDSVVHKIKKSDIIGVVQESMSRKILYLVSKVRKGGKVRKEKATIKKEKYEKPALKSQKIFETSTLACGKCKPGPIVQPSCTGFPKKS